MGVVTSTGTGPCCWCGGANPCPTGVIDNSIGCPSNPPPETVYMRIADLSGNCSCLAGTYPLTYDSGTDKWTGTAPACTNPVGLSFWLSHDFDGDHWNFQLTIGEDTVTSNVLAGCCAPLKLTADISDQAFTITHGGCDSGGANVSLRFWILADPDGYRTCCCGSFTTIPETLHVTITGCCETPQTFTISWFDLFSLWYVGISSPPNTALSFCGGSINYLEFQCAGGFGSMQLSTSNGIATGDPAPVSFSPFYWSSTFHDPFVCHSGGTVTITE